jgi:hypothetical protein
MILRLWNCLLWMTALSFDHLWRFQTWTTFDTEHEREWYNFKKCLKLKFVSDSGVKNEGRQKRDFFENWGVLYPFGYLGYWHFLEEVIYSESGILKVGSFYHLFNFAYTRKSLRCTVKLKIIFVSNRIIKLNFVSII